MTAICRVPLRELVEPVTTWSPRQSPGSYFDYIDLGAIDQGRKQIGTVQRLATSEAPSRARQIVNVGDVLVSTVRPNLNGVARVPEELDMATASTGFCVLRPTKELDRDYLFHWVRSPLFVDDMTSKATGASYPAVTDRIVKESTIPVVPLREQQKIAEALDRADGLRAKRKQTLAHLDDLAQS